MIYHKNVETDRLQFVFELERGKGELLGDMTNMILERE
jgi:hypothetical protein